MPKEIRGLLIHRCESGLTGEAVKMAEREEGLGYHFFINPKGGIEQLYPDTELVWHARRWSTCTLGIAVYGDFYSPDGSVHRDVTPEQWTSLVSLCRSLTQKHGNLFILGHTDMACATHDAGKVCPGDRLDVAKLTREVYAGEAGPLC